MQENLLSQPGLLAISGFQMRCIVSSFWQIKRSHWYPHANATVLSRLTCPSPLGRPSSSSIVGILAHALGSKGLLRLDSAFPGFPSDRIAP